MSTSKNYGHRNQPAPASPQLMSGAEMLVLQQSIKQYILTRQTRELTEHELQEFEKLRSRLLPSLQRYSQIHSQSNLPSTSATGTGLLHGHTANIAKINPPAFEIRSSLQQRQQQQQQSSGRSTTKDSTIYPMVLDQSAPDLDPKQASSPRTPYASATLHQPRRAVVALPKHSSNSRQPLIRREPPQPSNIIPRPTRNITPAVTATPTPNNTSRSVMSIKSGQKSDKKRPNKIAVYQDKENAPSKRRRLKKQGAGHESDSDKENRDPLSTTASTNTSKKTNILGEKTNLVKNVLDAAASKKGKEALRNVIASKIVDMAATAPVATPKKPKSAQQQIQKQAAHSHQTTLKSTAPVTASTEHISSVQTEPARKAGKTDTRRRKEQEEEPFTNTTPAPVSKAKESSTTFVLPLHNQNASYDHLLNVKQEPVDATEKRPADNIRKKPVDIIDGKPVSAIEKEPATVSRQLNEQKSSVQEEIEAETEIIRVPETPPRKTSVVTQIPGSVEDDSSTDSFGTQIKKERASRKIAVRPLADVDYEEIPGSQSSQDSFDLTASLEATFPMPEFLLEDLPEDSHQDEAEVTLVDADNSKQLNRRITIAKRNHTSLTNSQSNRESSPLQSTAFADGLWCIEDMKHRVVETVCGFQDQWIALETTDHIQFWRLDNDTPSLKSQWVRYIQIPKTSNQSTQILFAPNDSFAVVVEGSERTFTKVALQDLAYLQKDDVTFPVYEWTGVRPMLNCKGFIIEQDLNNHLFIFAADDAGTIGYVPVPKDMERGGSHGALQAKTMAISSAKELASSLILIRNTSLLAATFGSTVAIWDANSLDNPAMIVDTSSLGFDNPTLLYASVPNQFFEEERIIGDSRSLPTSWPILAVFHSSSPSKQCSLYAMKGNHIEHIHQYHGFSSTISVSASSRFIARLTMDHGKEVFRLWNISKPGPVVQLSLLEPPSLEDVASRRSLQQQRIWHQKAVSNIKQEESDIGGDTLDIFSSVSTLSSPPDDLSSPSSPFIEPGAETNTPLKTSDLQTPNPRQRHPIASINSQRQSGRSSRPPTDWIDLTSIAMMERDEVQFTIHNNQQWVVIVQKSTFKKKKASVVHILDLNSILSPSLSVSP
ncbi:hypothetical protein FBU30_001635 [Linnemannia zychae]|nr:hypothetical protein FBU30_001635 [Linnemannia zychae]